LDKCEGLFGVFFRLAKILKADPVKDRVVKMKFSPSPSLCF